MSDESEVCEALDAVRRLFVLSIRERDKCASAVVASDERAVDLQERLVRAEASLGIAVGDVERLTEELVARDVRVADDERLMCAAREEMDRFERELTATRAELLTQRAECDSLRKRVIELEEDACHMRRVSNIVVLEKKLYEIKMENEVLRRSLASARATSRAACRPGDGGSAAGSECAKGDGVSGDDASCFLKEKTIKGREYLVSSDAVYAKCDGGGCGSKVADLKTDGGRTRVVWL